MNNKKKGDDFEEKSVGIIRRMIEDESLGLLKNHIKIFKKRKYFSKLREKSIEFDLSIEVWPPNSERFALLYLIECKGYKDSVSVDKIETFHSKLVQLGLHNIKGIFISNSPIHEGGYNIAKSAGIMLVQGESKDNFEIILHKSSNRLDDNFIPFVRSTINIDLLDEGTDLLQKSIDKQITNSFKELIDSNHVSYNIDKLSKKQIKKIAEREILNFDNEFIEKAKSINIELFKRYLSNKLKVGFSYFEGGSDVLGHCNVRKKEIEINEVVKGTPRELFILSHEVGHLYLHQKLKIGQIEYDSFEDSKLSFKTGKYELNNPRHWIEWQANYFAASFVLPDLPLATRVLFFQKYYKMRKGAIIIDDNQSNQQENDYLFRKLADFFCVTKTSIIYKLEELNLIKNNSKLKPISQLYSEYKDSFLK